MKPRPNSMVILFVVLNIGTKLQPCDSAVRLPYEVENTIIEHTDPSEYVRGLDKVNVFDANVTRAIYRKDLPSYYVAYYEIEAEGKYIVLSAGSKTGDYREAESGPSPRPTDVLSQQAKKHGQTCIKYFRLSPFGLMICENEEGKAVAATFNWTSDVSEIINWNELDQMIKKDSKQFMRSWRLWAKDVNKSSEWETTELLNNNRGSKEFEAEGIALGSAVNLALPMNFESIRIYIRDLGKKVLKKSFRLWQRRLCREVLFNICSDDGKVVNKNAIKKTSNGFPYLLIKVKKEGVQDILKYKEVGFVVAISSKDGETLLKHYAIDLGSTRQKRWSLVTSSSWKEWSIPREDYFPDYNQHDCCGCVSGCTPVAWAQIFAYYDILAHSSTNYGHSKRLFRCGGTSGGSPFCVAPRTMTSSVKTFVEDIRARLKTYCKNGEGSTKRKNNKRINKWYKSRQGNSAKVKHYPFWMALFGKRSTVGQLTVYGHKGKVRDQAIKALKGNPAYPVAVSIKVAFNGGKKGGHSAVVTKYREKWRKYRKYHCKKVGFWWAKKTKCQYIWKTVYDRKFFFHMGWGGRRNAWHTALAETASIAKP